MLATLIIGAVLGFNLGVLAAALLWKAPGEHDETGYWGEPK